MSTWPDVRPEDLPRELRTERLLLRRWTAADRAPFAALNADPVVMEHLLGPVTRAESDAMVDRIDAHFATRGFAFWALEVPGVTELAGFVGLVVPRFEAHFTPCVEIGWRLARPYWGAGYATEAARAALAFGFGRLGVHEIVALTVPSNQRSQKVMERLGMRRNPEDDFDHPLVPAEHPLRRHILYRIGAPASAG